MLSEERADEARALLRSRSAEEQAALVAIDADPEQVLALTASDGRGLAAYSRDVVDRLTDLNLGQVVGGTEVGSVSLFQTMAEGFAWTRPCDYVSDAATAEVLDTLWEAAPELLASTVVSATRRLHGTG